jgi:hypothetical protein
LQPLFHQPLTLSTGNTQDGEHRSLVDVAYPCRAPNAATLHETGDDSQASFQGNPKIVKRAFAVRECLSTLATPKTLYSPSPVISEPLHFDAAVVAGHFGSCLSSDVEPK